MERAFINWSGGKDCMLALHHLQNEKKYNAEFLFTTVSGVTDRVTMHGVRKELITRQRFALNIPSRKLYLPENATHEKYNALMQHEMNLMKERGITNAVFGDIFLEDLRKYREEQLAKAGINAIFPLWNRDTKDVLNEFLEKGFKAIIVCADASKLGKEYTGKLLDNNFINTLPDDVDPCGENGEFHTFVFDGPGFIQPVKFTIGENVYKEYDTNDKSVKSKDFWFTDLIPYE